MVLEAQKVCSFSVFVRLAEPCEEHVEQCRESSVEGEQFPDQAYCENYYTCISGSLEGPEACPQGQLFDAVHRRCDRLEQADCDKRCPPPHTTVTENLFTTQGIITTVVSSAATTMKGKDTGTPPMPGQ